MKEQNNAVQEEFVSYRKDKIQILFNILNSIQFTGIHQAQAITQISAILGEPIVRKEDNQNIESGD